MTRPLTQGVVVVLINTTSDNVVDRFSDYLAAGCTCDRTLIPQLAGWAADNALLAISHDRCHRDDLEPRLLVLDDRRALDPRRDS